VVLHPLFEGFSRLAPEYYFRSLDKPKDPE